MFIGHSLGGIVVKRALVNAQLNSTNYKDISESTKSIIFFGTPHQGTNVTEWPQMLESISKVAGIKRSKVLKELELWSDFLVELSQTFLEQSNKLLITSFYERQPYNGMGEFQTVHRQLHMRLCDIQEMPGAIWNPPRVDDFDELMEALRPRSGRVEGNTSSERIKSPAK
ncbi:unnamed protein product [Alternaria alternata]